MSALEIALAWARWGIRVLPLHTVSGRGCTCPDAEWCELWGAHPRGSMTALDATTNATTIASWWCRWPDARPGRALLHGGYETLPDTKSESVDALDHNQLDLLFGERAS